MSVSSHVAGTVKVVINWSGPNNTIAANIFHCLVPAGGDPTNTTLLAAIATAFYTGCTGTGSVGSSIVGNPWFSTLITAYDNSGASSNYGTSPSNITGSVTGGCFPPNCAYVTSWKILESYKGGHPRTYWPGVPISAVTTPGSNDVSPAYYSGANAAITKLQSEITGTSIGGLTGWEMGCIRKTSKTGLVSPRFVSFQTFVHNLRVDSQRRRLGT